MTAREHMIKSTLSGCSEYIIEIPDQVITLLSLLMRKWKTKLKIWKDGKKSISRWIGIMCSFLQGDSYLSVEFCISEIPLCKLLQESKGYRIGQPKKRDVNRTHSLFVDDLEVYQESYKTLKDVNEMIVQVSNDMGACCGVAKFFGFVFERGKMVKVEGLQVLNERIKTIDLDENAVYKFLGVEQADGIKKKEVYNRVKEEISRRMNLIARTELNNKYLVNAISPKVIPVAAYPMNICKFTQSELTEVQVIKRDLRKNNMLGRQASDERFYMKRKYGGRGLKSLREVYDEIRLRAGSYMFVSDNT